jgi:hypothetical protein
VAERQGPFATQVGLDVLAARVGRKLLRDVPLGPLLEDPEIQVLKVVGHKPQLIEVAVGAQARQGGRIVRRPHPARDSRARRGARAVQPRRHGGGWGELALQPKQHPQRSEN